MIFLGDLPKPLHGMSAMNQQYRDYFNPEYVINTAPSFAYKLFDGFLWKILKIALVIPVSFLILFARLKGERVCYRSLNGGIGQVYDLLYLLLLRALSFKIFLHHHSFNYLSKYSLLFRVNLSVLGEGATHIVLGQRMKDQLIEIYGVSPSKIMVVSNSVFFEPQSAQRLNNTPVLGYMANLTLEKGVAIFLDACKELIDRGVDFQAKIAGPIAGPGVQEVISEFVDLGVCEYVGPVYGECKDSFLSDLDIFAFPSQYKNEAEPLVLYEAAQYGALVVVTDVGCLADVSRTLGGATIESAEATGDKLADSIEALIPLISCDAKMVVKERLERHIDSSLTSLHALGMEMDRNAKA